METAPEQRQMTKISVRSTKLGKSDPSAPIAATAYNYLGGYQEDTERLGACMPIW